MSVNELQERGRGGEHPLTTSRFASPLKSHILSAVSTINFILLFHSYFPSLLFPTMQSLILYSIYSFLHAEEKKPYSFPLPAWANVFVLGKVQVYLSAMLPMQKVYCQITHCLYLSHLN